MSFTVEQCQAHLDAWLEADLAVSKGQSYTIGKRVLTRVNATEIAKNIRIWEDRLQQAKRKSSGPRTIQIIPRYEEI